MLSWKSVFSILLKCYLKPHWGENSRIFCVCSTGKCWNNKIKDDSAFEVLRRIISSPSLERKLPVREIIFRWKGLSYMRTNVDYQALKVKVKERGGKAKENCFQPRIPNPAKRPKRGGQKTTVVNHIRTWKICLPCTVSRKATKECTPPKWGPKPRKRTAKETGNPTRKETRGWGGGKFPGWHLCSRPRNQPALLTQEAREFEQG